jgi:hypothetical protein
MSDINVDLPKTLVTVAPGRSMREPLKVHKTTVRTQSGTLEERTVDVEYRTVLPGDKISVFSKDVPALIATGAILDPATQEVAPIVTGSAPELSK